MESELFEVRIDFNLEFSRDYSSPWFVFREEVADKRVTQLGDANANEAKSLFEYRATRRRVSIESL